MLTVKEAAERIGITPAAVYIAIKDKRLKAQKMYGRILLKERDVQEYAETAGARNGYVNRTRQH